MRNEEPVNRIRDIKLIIYDFMEFMNNSNVKITSPDTQYIVYHLIERIMRDEIDDNMIAYEKLGFKPCAWNEKEIASTCNHIVTEMYKEIKEFKSKMVKDEHGNIKRV